MMRGSSFGTIILSAVAMSICTVSCNKSESLFKSLPSSETGITFSNRLPEQKLLNILYYLYYYNGGGVATGDINNDGLTDIYFTANTKGANKLYLNKGGLRFEDITDKAGVGGTADWCSGVTMADVNGDGLLDIYVSAVANIQGLKGNNQLFINNGNATFTESADRYNLAFSGLATQAAFFDFDHDGDLDCYLLNHSKQPHANIVDTFNRRKYDALSGDKLFRNDLNTTQKFTDVSAEAGIYQSNLGYGLGVAIADINNDGWEDIYVGNDFHENDYYYVNNGNGTFSESGSRHFRHYSRFSMGNDAADYNNDGHTDLITVDMLPFDEKTLKTYGSDENPDIYKVKLELNGYQHQYSRNCLQQNNGNGASFSDVALLAGVAATDWSWSPLFADFDNDGNKDLFISSGIVKRPVDLDYVRFISDLEIKKNMNQTDQFDAEAIAKMPDGSSHPFLFKGNGKNVFEDVSVAWGTKDMQGYFNGAAYSDLDNDGDLDLVMNCINAPAVLLQNNAPQKKFISISFRGDSLNRFGVGCKAYLFSRGNMQYQHLMLTRGFQSSKDTRLHFGLDTTTVIDSIVVVWPDQQYQVLKQVPASKPLLVSQSDASGAFNPEQYLRKEQKYLKPIDGLTSWRHRENEFQDYNVQYLIPHAQSTRGPKLAVADVNGDGLDDFFVCGATGQAGAMMLQTKSGTFVSSSDTAVFNLDKECEDVAAIFFDANKDAFPDLYVVSGGNQFDDGDNRLADRLYINDGKGHFIKSDNSLPKLFSNKSTVSAADYDKDGDFDLFVGGLANAKKFGLPQTSYLLQNDGTGRFQQADASVADFNAVGMVTSSAFADLNNDSWPDLVVAGEWMPLKVFMNNKGSFQLHDLAASSGLWQTVLTTDVNGDGHLDIMAGNWGHNSKLYAGKNGPCKLYVKDFDKNGSIEQIMAYTINRKEYTFLAKDELERRMPVLKKAYLTYGEVAGKTVDYVFYDLFQDYLELKAEVLASCYFINDGKGGFKKNELPPPLQTAPVMCIAASGNSGTPTLLAAGNFYGVTPYEGRYDALSPTVFSFKSNGANIQYALPFIDGEVRDVKWINHASGKKIVVIARNNEALIFLTP